MPWEDSDDPAWVKHPAYNPINLAAETLGQESGLWNREMSLGDISNGYPWVLKKILRKRKKKEFQGPLLHHIPKSLNPLSADSDPVQFALHMRFGSLSPNLIYRLVCPTFVSTARSLSSASESHNQLIRYLYIHPLFSIVT